MERVINHQHTGTDSDQLDANVSIKNSPQSALTSAAGGVLTSGGGGALNTADQIILQNMRDRIDEIETKLRAIGLLL